MIANEQAKPKNRFRNRRKLLVAIAAVGAIVLLAVLLVAFSAPKNELLTEAPTLKSRLWFIGPLRQPVSDAWQRFRATRLKPPPQVACSVYQLNPLAEIPSELGNPILTNSMGVRAWIVPKSHVAALLTKPKFVNIGIKETLWEGVLVNSYIANYHRLIRVRSRSSAVREVDVFVTPPISIGTFTSTNHPSLREFGVHATVPNGAGVLLLGPTMEFSPETRFACLVVPE